MLLLLALALAEPADGPAPATIAAIDALTLHVGQGRMAEAEVEEARRQACSLGAELLCEGWPDVVTLQAACIGGDPAGCVGVAWDLVLHEGRIETQARDPAKAAATFRAACDHGYLRACLAHAQLEQRGIGLEAAPEGAVAVFRSLCDRGEPWACIQLGKALQVGAGVPADPDQARTRFTAACDAGLPAGCGALALVLHLGVGGDKDVAGALAGYRSACDQGFLPACDNLGMLYEAGLTELDAGPRRTALAQGCEEGRPAACGHLGDVLVDIDPEKALAGYRTACDAGLARGCRGVGLHARATGDLVTAVELVRGACDAGDPAACRAWGDMLARGEGVERDLEAAFAARRVGCTNGDGEACFEAGRQLHKGKGAAKDRDAAASMRERACGLGYAAACD
jgi:TPR repeat protein